MKKLVIIMLSFAVLGVSAFPCSPAKSPASPADLGNPAAPADVTNPAK